MWRVLLYDASHAFGWEETRIIRVSSKASHVATWERKSCVAKRKSGVAKEIIWFLAKYHENYALLHHMYTLLSGVARVVKFLELTQIIIIDKIRTQQNLLEIVSKCFPLCNYRTDFLASKTHSGKRALSFQKWQTGFKT